MNKNAKKAYDELKKIGCPVRSPWGGNEHFSISAESNFDPAYGDKHWADYYAMTDGGPSYLDCFGINKEIANILEANGLYAEWYNPGVLSVYDA